MTDFPLTRSRLRQYPTILRIPLFICGAESDGERDYERNSDDKCDDSREDYANQVIVTSGQSPPKKYDVNIFHAALEMLMHHG